MIQAVEVEAIISNEGEMTNVRLPESCKKWFGNNAKLILILQEPYSNFALTVATESKDRIQQQKIDKWRGLLKATQSLSSSKEIDDADIAFEIESYRSNGQ